MRRVSTALLLSLLLLLTAACGGSGSGTASSGTASSGTASSGSSGSGAGSSTTGIPGLKVGGAFGSTPDVTFTTPLKPAGIETKVVSTGDGNPAKVNQKTMLDIYLANGTSGKKIYSSADQGRPEQVTLADGQFFKPIIDALVGKPRGTRLAVAASVKDLWGAQGAPAQLQLKPTDSAMFVIDLLSVAPQTVLKGPRGTAVKPPADAPKVMESGGKVTGFDWSKAPKQPPKKLEVIPLTKGTGPVVKSGRLVTFNYYGAVWQADKPFDSSYTRGAPVPFGVGVNSLIKAWDQGIPGLRRGSRVLIIAPPSVAYGSQAQPNIPAGSTLAFVVDVLGVDS